MAFKNTRRRTVSGVFKPMRKQFGPHLRALEGYPKRAFNQATGGLKRVMTSHTDLLGSMKRGSSGPRHAPVCPPVSPDPNCPRAAVNESQ